MSLLLVLLSGVFWSLGGVLVRLVDLASGWQIIFYRSATQTVVLFMAMWLLPNGPLLKRIVAMGPLLKRIVAMGLYGAAASVLLTSAFIAFVFSILATNVANTLLILSTVPFIAALGSFLLLGERPSRAIMIGAVAACIGVMIMVGSDMSGEYFHGNMIAIVGAFSFAGYVVFMRAGHATDMLPANAVAGILSALVAFWFLDSLNVSQHDLGLCITLGVFQTGLGLILFTLGSRQLPGSELALLSLIHVVLGPIWVLVLVGEVPKVNVLIGGVLVLAAIVIPAVRDLKRRPS